MKKNLSVLVWFFTLCLFLASCSGDSGDNPSEDTKPEDTTVYYRLTLDANGGEGSTSYDTIKANQSFVLEKAAALGIERTGYTFAGWARSATAEKATYADGGTVMVNADITLYAVWIKNAVSGDNEQTDGTDQTQTPPETSADTDGTDNQGETPKNIDTGDKQDDVLPKPTYTVTFNTNGGTEILSQTVESGNTASEPTVPTKEGFTFAGWYTSSALTTMFDFSTAITEDITLYAKWIAASVPSCTVTFISNGGTVVAPQTVEIGGMANEPTAPTKTGYTFGGWYTTSELTTIFNFGTVLTENVTVYAKWTINSYNITFYTDGGSYISPASVTYGGTVAEPSIPTKAGYTFDGWYIDSGLNESFRFGEYGTVITTHTTLYAKWTINTYTVTFDTDGGSSVSSQSVIYNKTASEPPVPTKTGYAFAGWYADSGLTNSFTFGTAITENITLYAKWLQNTAGITVTILPNATITVDATETGSTLTLSASSGHTSYTWKIDGTPAADVAGATVNEHTLTITKTSLIAGAVYQISLYAPKDGIPYSAQIAVTKGE